MKILDVCCGSRMFWYDKQEPHTTYMDIRKAIYTAMDRGNERRIEIAPDVQADWKSIPFDREKFEWLLSEPVGKKKVEEAVRIKHECAKMARRNAYDV